MKNKDVFLKLQLKSFNVELDKSYFNNASNSLSTHFIEQNWMSNTNFTFWPTEGKWKGGIENMVLLQYSIAMLDGCKSYLKNMCNWEIVSQK